MRGFSVCDLGEHVADYSSSSCRASQHTPLIQANDFFDRSLVLETTKLAGRVVNARKGKSNAGIFFLIRPKCRRTRQLN